MARKHGTAQGRSRVKEEALASLQGSCPLGLLPTLGPWALVPAREQSGTLALLPEPLRAISRHKILRPAKSHNVSMARPQVTFSPTPQLPTRGIPGEGPCPGEGLLGAGPPFCVANTSSLHGSSLASPRAEPGDTLRPQAPHQGLEPEAGQLQGLLRPPPGLPSQGFFPPLG